MPYVDKVKSVKKTRGFPNRGERYGAKYENWVAYLLSILILYQSKNCGYRIHILFMMYDVYWYCQMKKNERLWKFWKRNDLYENFEKRVVVEKRGEEEMKSMPHAPVVIPWFWHHRSVIPWFWRHRSVNHVISVTNHIYHDSYSWTYLNI